MGKIIVHEHSNVLAAQGERILIAHVVNDLGVMGAGLAKQMRAKWPGVYHQYREFVHLHRRESLLGTVQFVQVQEQPHLVVANCFAQHGIRSLTNLTPFSLDAFRTCLAEVGRDAVTNQLEVHMPYGIGAGLAGGKWSEIEHVIWEVCCVTNGLTVHLHKL